eukprot:5976697-Amphidinium_carterae.1
MCHRSSSSHILGGRSWQRSLLECQSCWFSVLLFDCLGGDGEVRAYRILDVATAGRALGALWFPAGTEEVCDLPELPSQWCTEADVTMPFVRCSRLVVLLWLNPFAPKS